MAEKMEKRLDDWHDRLRERYDRESDEQKRADQSTVLKYLEEYQQQLAGHVIDREGDREPLVVCRTNNPAERRWKNLPLGD